jgi:hypothetical protein
MALAIDTRYLLEQWVPDQEDYLDAYVGSRGRFQLHRVCAYATIVHNCSTFKRQRFDPDVQQSALNWQADPDDDLHEVEVFHHLKQLAATSSLVPPEQASTTTTLVASALSPTFLARVQDPSAFHRYSVKMIMEEKGNGHTYASKTSLSDVISSRRRLWACVNDPKLVWASATERHDLSVVWHIQLDFVDLHSPVTDPDSTPGKRRRTLNAFQQVPSREDASRDLPEAKRFNGVRFRPDRNRWVAEMKPPRSKNKVSFGDFKSQTEAARVVDVAFHYYGKPLNFADTPQILSTQPSAAGLDEEATLKLVKEQARWLASRAAAASEHVETSESSSICTAVTSRFRSFSEITLSSLSCGGTDEADDGISQPSFVETMEPSFTDEGVVNEEGQSVFLRGHVENATWVDPCDVLTSREYSSGTRTTFVSSPGVEQPFRIQRTSMDFLILSPPAPVSQLMRSPRIRHGV